MEALVFVSLMILILIICVLGLIGNFLTTIILLKKQMRSSTNYFLLGLTISDLLLLILSFTRTLNNLTPFLSSNPSSTSSIAIYLWDWTATSGTRYFTVIVSLERAIAVCAPLKARSWITRRRAKYTAFATLGFNLSLAIGAFCYNKYAAAYGFELFAALILHFIPFVVIAIVNIIIYFAIQKFKATRATLTNSETKEISITKMLLTVVLVFGFCHSFEIVRRILNYAHYFDFNKYEYYDYTISYLADIFYVLNSSVNTIIYYLMVAEFRKEFLNLFHHHCLFCICIKNGSTSSRGQLKEDEESCNHSSNTINSCTSTNIATKSDFNKKQISINNNKTNKNIANFV